MATVINNPSVIINANPVSVLANSVSFVEGLGEQDYKVQSTGGGNIQPVTCDNIESKIGEIKFTLLSTIENIELARQLKVLGSANLIKLSGTDATTGTLVTRTFSNATLTNNYEVTLSNDGNIPLEWKANVGV